MIQRPHLPFRKVFLHLILISIIWIFYIKGLTIFWFNPIGYVYKTLAIAIFAECLLLFAIILSWITYHVFLHRSKIPRTHVPDKTWSYHKDRLQYEVIADFQVLSAAKTISLHINRDKKTKIYLSRENPGYA